MVTAEPRGRFAAFAPLRIRSQTVGPGALALAVLTILGVPAVAATTSAASAQPLILRALWWPRYAVGVFVMVGRAGTEHFAFRRGPLVGTGALGAKPEAHRE